MATILKATTAVMPPLASLRPLTKCADVPYRQVPPYALATIDKFLGNPSLVYTNQMPSMNMYFEGFCGPRHGHTVVVNGVAPVLKVNAGFKRPHKKGIRSYKEYKKLMEQGKIITTDRSVGSITVRDQVLPLGGVKIASYTQPIYDEAINASRVSVREPCRAADRLGLQVTPTGYFFPDSMYNLGVVGTYSIKGTYERWDGVELSTLLTSYSSDVEAAIGAIMSVYEGLSPTESLITSSVSELNASVFDAATELAELPSLVSMIMEGCKKCLLYYKETRQKVNLLRRRKQTVDDLPAEIAQLWLQYRYGIQPIAYSINDALDQLEMSGVLYRTVRRSLKHDLQVSVEGWEFSSPLQVHERSWCKGRVSAASVTNGLGLNPLVTAWELLPLSFVVDWFLNIGDLISALVPTMDFQERAFTSSKRCKQAVVGKHLISGAKVSFEVDLYDCNNIIPIDHFGLTFEPLQNIKRALDTLSLGWLMFIEEFRRKK